MVSNKDVYIMNMKQPDAPPITLAQLLADSMDETPVITDATPVYAPEPDKVMPQ